MDSTSAVVSVLGGIIGIALHAIALTYIQKLERINCPCAEHPYRKFLKYFMIVSIVIIALHMFAPFYNLGAAPDAVGFAIGAFLMLWAVALVVFYVAAIIYVRHLVREKCSCSEDVRREVLYIWSILELLFLGIVLFLSIFISLTSSVVAAAVSKVQPKSLRNLQNEIIGNTTNPIRALSKSANAVGTQLKRVSNKFR